MASTILTRTFGVTQDNRASMNNSNFVRPIAIDYWSKIRIAVRVSITDPGAGIWPNPWHFAVGLCSGSTAIFNDASTTQFVGMISNIGTGAWQLNTVKTVGPPFRVAMRWFPATKIGTTLAGITGGTAGPNPYVDSYLAQYDDGTGLAPRRSLYFVDILRPGGATAPTAGAYTIHTFHRSGVVNNYDATNSDFLTKAVDLTPDVPPLLDHTYRTDPSVFGNPAATLDVSADEITYGALDHVCVAWQTAKCDLEVSEVGFTRLI